MKSLGLPKEKIFICPALLWKRVIAFFIDMLIVNLVILFPFRGLLQNIIPKGHSFSEAYKFLSSGANYTSFITSISFIMSIFIIMYFLMLERKTAQTIGKMLMKIYVVSDNDNIKAWQLFTRNLVFIPIFPFVLLWVLDPLFMFFTKTNQRLTEILSKTKTVEKFRIQ